MKNKDQRINAKRTAWAEYLIIWIVMLCLTGGQALILSEYSEILNDIPLSFLFANIGYWGLITLVFCFITRYMRRRTWEKPMETLSTATKQVAEGDFSVFVRPIRKDGKKDYVEVMFDDFNKMVEELSTIETMKTDFISNVSHEIKTPLSVIQNYAFALQKADISPEQRQEYTDTIITATHRLNTLVANILKLSKLENQKIVPTFEEYNLCSQLAECALSFEELWESRGITFTAEMDDTAVIRADKSMLEIVWNNLLSNALKFTEPGGTVTLTQTSDEDTVTVSVTDTGCGMTEATLHRIFDKFYQGDTSRAGEGNGLGLALALRVVELLGGQISVRSEVGEGAAFTVKLKTE
ncbi:MAG: HAMP domain-containing histidine kinase [Oscillospiraceae bacterium]|jgi:signal transduction histidine kinase|nr:HAMP domain-containing histidine kinase [Oscillospiraceae bacterium]